MNEPFWGKIGYFFCFWFSGIDAGAVGFLLQKEERTLQRKKVRKGWKEVKKKKTKMRERRKRIPMMKGKQKMMTLMPNKKKRMNVPSSKRASMRLKPSAAKGSARSLLLSPQHNTPPPPRGRHPRLCAFSFCKMRYSFLCTPIAMPDGVIRTENNVFNAFDIILNIEKILTGATLRKICRILKVKCSLENFMKEVPKFGLMI